MIDLEVADNEHFYVAFARWWQEDWSWEALAYKIRKGSLGDDPQPHWGNLQTVWEGERLYQFGGRNWTRFHLPPMDMEGKLCPEDIWVEAKGKECAAILDAKLAAVKLPEVARNDHDAKDIVDFCDLRGVVFPEDFGFANGRPIVADFSGCMFLFDFNSDDIGRPDIIAKFDGAMFVGQAFFRRTAFKTAASFSGAYFCDGATFAGSTFFESAGFGEVVFARCGEFDQAIFEGYAHFDDAVIERAVFADTNFKLSSSFDGAVFVGEAFFMDATFERTTGFEHARFKGATDFVGVGWRESDGGGAINEAMPTQRAPRKTYRQDWPAYNAAQTHEKAKFQELLQELCRDIKEPIRSRNGRPRLPVEDAIFACCFKVYSTVSGRRFMTDLREAHRKGLVSKVPHFNTIFNYLEDKDLTPILRELVTRSSLPLRAIETDFAVNSSGFSTSRFVRWFDQKYRTFRQEHDWVKVHLMVGVRTNIITAVEIRERHAADTKSLPYLVDMTAENFEIREVSADKAYASLRNYDAIDWHGATPFIAFRANATGTRGGLWEKMFLHFQLRREDFLAHYHKRSNVESTFSMTKAKFRDHVRSKTPVAMVNEALCKLICHNICVLIQEAHELGIEMSWAGSGGT